MWLRTASKDDLEEIQKLLKETWHATYDDMIGVEAVSRLSDEMHSLEMLKKYLSRPHSEYIVADDGESLHGVAYAAQGAVKSDPDAVKLFQLYVRPESQSQGIGRQLLIEIEESFPNARRIRLDIFEKNSRAIQFYESQGYKQSVKKAQDGDFPEISMEKSIF